MKIYVHRRCSCSLCNARNAHNSDKNYFVPVTPAALMMMINRSSHRRILRCCAVMHWKSASNSRWLWLSLLVDGLDPAGGGVIAGSCVLEQDTLL